MVGGPAAAWLAAALAATVAAAVIARPWAVAAAAIAAGGASAAGPRPEVGASAGVHDGVVARPTDDIPGGRRVLVDLESGGRALVWEREPRVALLPGDRVRFAGLAAPPRPPTVEGAFD